MSLDPPDPDLTDGVVRLRRWRYDDDACVTAAGTDPGIVVGTTVPANGTAAQCRAFIERQWNRHDDGQGVSLAIAHATTDESVGLAILLHRPYPGVVGLGYWVVPAARRAGLAGRAVRLLTDWALTCPDVHRVEALTHADNVASQRTLRGAGFAREGVLRSQFARGDGRIDGVLFSRIRPAQCPATQI